MKVREVMHKGVDWVDPDTPVTDLAKLMRQHDIGAIPIGENDRLIGMVIDREHRLQRVGGGQLRCPPRYSTRRDDSRHPLLPRG